MSILWSLIYDVVVFVDQKAHASKDILKYYLEI